MERMNTHRSPGKGEEVEQLKAAGARLVQRAKEDPAVAEKFLREIGYYEAMAHQKAEEEASSSQADLHEDPSAPWVAANSNSDPRAREL